MTFNKPTTSKLALAAILVATAEKALAAAGTSSAATSMSGVSGAFTDLLGGSGGTLIIVIGVIFAAVAFMFRPSWQIPGALLVTSGLIGYGVNAMEGFGSVSAAIPEVLPNVAMILHALPASI